MGKKSVELHKCGECENIMLLYEPHNLLSVEGKPTMGRCPHWTESRSALLSWPHECDFFRKAVAKTSQDCTEVLVDG